MDGARVPGLVISLVLITHGYIILISDGFMPAWMRIILSGFSRNPLVGFGRIIQHIPTSLSMMTTIRDGFLSILKPTRTLLRFSLKGLVFSGLIVASD